MSEVDTLLYRMPARDRYNRDPGFSNLVNYMHAMIERSQFSPSELREAAMLAACMYEERRTVAFVRRESLPPTQAELTAVLAGNGGGYEPEPMESEE